MGSPPSVVEGSAAGGGCFPSPVRVGSPNDGVPVLLDVLVLDDRASCQRDRPCTPVPSQQNPPKNAQTQVRILTAPGRVTRRRERDCVVWGPIAEFRNRPDEEDVLCKNLGRRNI